MAQACCSSLWRCSALPCPAVPVCRDSADNDTSWVGGCGNGPVLLYEREDRHYWRSEIMVAGNRPWGWCSLADLRWLHQSGSSCLCIFTMLACMKRKSDVCFYYEHCNDKVKSKWWMYKFQPCKLLLCMQGWCLRQFLSVEIINPLGVAEFL